VKQTLTRKKGAQVSSRSELVLVEFSAKPDASKAKQ
jgi:hypothetical protein